MNILGISCFYHDSAACLLKDGKIIAAAQEERFTRKKHDVDFPEKAIRYCLEEGGIKIEDVDYISFYEKPLMKLERILHQHLEMFPRSYWSFYSAMPSWINQKLRVPSIIRKKLKYKGKIFFVEHHMAHAASSFLVSPYKKAAILTTDGVGEWATTTTGIGEENSITLNKEISFPSSLGLLYSTVTAYLGFRVNDAEYKVMGLSAYGRPVYYEKFKKIIDIREDGSYQLDMSYFDFHYKLSMPGKKFVKEFGPPRKKESGMERRFENMAASLQKITEEIIIKMLNSLHEETKMDKLCMAGGVALNSVANGKILKNTGFKEVYIQPASSDAGTAVGAACYAYNTILGNKREYVMSSADLGPGYSTGQIRKFLEENSIAHKEFKNENELVKMTAYLIKKGKVVGWFQGRMEWGPRALGNRSILSDATNPKMKDILNLKVKHREPFRPFAPVITVEDAKEYFECDNPVPMPTDFMLMVYPIKKEKQKIIPAVTHVDGTGRLQTIRREQNPRYYDTIKEFEKLSSTPILINTSFNIRGEPIVCTPQDAYRCMMGTGIDYLVIGGFIVAREDNPKDKWDSEALSKGW